MNGVRDGSWKCVGKDGWKVAKGGNREGAVEGERDDPTLKEGGGDRGGNSATGSARQSGGNR